MGKVAFDFDGTLEQQNVQKYAKELVDRGVDVWIVTTRWDETCKTLSPVYYAVHGDRIWEEVFEVADRLGIKRENIVFNNYQYKHTYFKDHTDFKWLLNDNYDEHKLLKGIIPSVDVTLNGWKSKCEELLNKN